jgi:hypothetical protein
MLGIGRENQRVGECQAATLGDRLNRHIDILAPTEAMGEMDETDFVQMAGCEVAGGVQLFRQRGVRDDDTRNRGSVEGTYEDVVRGSPNSTMVGGDAEKSDTKRAVDVVAGIEEAHSRIDKWAIRKQEFGVVGRAGHRAVVGVSIHGGGLRVICGR